MSFKVLNQVLAGLEVIISSERVLFSPEGIAEIQSEEIYNEVLTLKNFYAVRGAEDPQVPVEPQVGDNTPEAPEALPQEEGKTENQDAPESTTSSSKVAKKK